MKSTLFLLLFSFQILSAQTDTMPTLPYYEIPEAPTSFTANHVAARMIDGLGFRYYWATEGLREEDLQYQPGEEARTTAETIEHIHGLTQMVLNAVKNQANVRGEQKETLTFVEQRAATLNSLKEASDLLRSSEESEMENFNIIFQRNEQTSEFPFWNVINGPLSDALWHVGQVVSYRRSSGNPLNGKISVFSGTVRK